jgi:ribosomal protein S18 acetylase RimI-like enzyme
MTGEIESRLDERTLIRRARAEDFDAVYAVVLDAIRRVQEKGYAQWKFYQTPEGIQNVRDKLAGVRDEEVYVAERDGRTIRTMAVQWEDLDCWPTSGNDTWAGYVHMLAVHRDARRAGLGEKMLAWAGRLMAERGKRYFRLDCWNGGPFLNSYYPRLGFSVVIERGAPKGVRNYQKQVRSP